MESVAGGLDGVLSVSADFVGGTATIEYDPARVAPEQIVAAINDQTFYRARLPEAKTATVVIAVPGLTDQAAADQINAAFAGLEGIYGGEAAPGQLTIQFDPDRVSAEALVARVNERTTLTASLASLELLAEERPTLSLQNVTRYGVWGAAALGLLWWSGALRFMRRRLLQPLRLALWKPLQ